MSIDTRIHGQAIHIVNAMLCETKAAARSAALAVVDKFKARHQLQFSVVIALVAIGPDSERSTAGKRELESLVAEALTDRIMARLLQTPKPKGRK